MANRLIWFSLGFLCVGVQGCCRVNRLPDRSGGQLKISVTVQVQEEPTVMFTRHRNLRLQGAPQGGRSHSEFQYAEVLESFDYQTVAHGLATGFAAAKPRSGWWTVVQDDQEPEAELSLEVEQYCFCAGDPLMPVELRWNLRATLIDTVSGEMLWRDCLDWTSPLEGASMDQLGRAEADRRTEHLNQALKLLASRLAEHLALQK